MADPAEWLEADGLGGFASGTADGIRTRRYHALLLVQTAQGRVALVNGIEAWVSLAGGDVAISSQFYAPGVVHPDGASRIVSFESEPWPCWGFALPDGSVLLQEVFVAGGQTCLRWTRRREGAARLHVRLLLSCRDYHGLRHEGDGLVLETESGAGCTVWRNAAGGVPVAAWGGAFEAGSVWFRQFLYAAERERGLDDLEDLVSPGVLSWDLVGPATLALRADADAAGDVGGLAETERARRRALPRLGRAAGQYLAARAGEKTIVAGYPWFTDWGRDSFIAMRGLLLATGRVAEAEAVLLAWAGHVREGMLPNRFPDGAGAPEYNAVDASLWFVVAVHDLLAKGACGGEVRLKAACTAILEGYMAGTRYGIGADADGLLRAGVAGVQLTWMDAKVGDWVVTPRIGKPVEVQALWINALRIAGAWVGGERWAAAAQRATEALVARFVDAATGGLLDVVDGDATEGVRVRPNQVFAVGGLPFCVVPEALARGVVEVVEQRLLTPLGLRTLDPADAAYQGRYAGGPLERDGAYHQGTVWPWLLGPFVEAWLRVRGDTAAARAEAGRRFLPALEAHLLVAGLGHVSEVADGDWPHRPGGVRSRRGLWGSICGYGGWWGRGSCVGRLLGHAWACSGSPRGLT